jgi:hypothetical protein
MSNSLNRPLKAIPKPAPVAKNMMAKDPRLLVMKKMLKINSPKGLWNWPGYLSRLIHKGIGIRHNMECA